jgi:uncharacterized protein YjdB
MAVKTDIINKMELARTLLPALCASEGALAYPNGHVVETAIQIATEFIDARNATYADPANQTAVATPAPVPTPDPVPAPTPTPDPTPAPVPAPTPTPDPTPAPVPASTPVVSVDIRGITLLSVGQTLQLRGIPRDASNGVLTVPVLWSASPSSVASISDTGLVTANSAGTAQITATAGGATRTLPLTVQ